MTSWFDDVHFHFCVNPNLFTTQFVLDGETTPGPVVAANMS